MANKIIELFETKEYVKISAPMVRYSKVDFRILVRKYGVDVAFSPMIMADSFHKSEKARNADFATDLNDRPLVVQFAANEGPTLVKAVSYITKFCDGIDINCGCPQKWIHKLEMGSELLKYPERVEDMIKNLARNFNDITKSIKIRLQSDLHGQRKIFGWRKNER